MASPINTTSAPMPVLINAPRNTIKLAVNPALATAAAITAIRYPTKTLVAATA